MGVTSPVSRGYFAIILLGLSLFCAALSASTDDYLEAVKADAEEFFSKEFKPPADSSWAASMAVSDAPGTSQLEGLEGFSDFIKKKSPGSHIFYRKLPPEIQAQVYEEYLTTGDLERTKKSIFELSRKTKKRSRR